DLLVFADAGILDEDVEAPELLRGTVDEGEACGLGTNVSLREGDLGAGGLELGRHALAPPVTAATLPSSLPMVPTFHCIAKRASTIRRIHPAGTALLARPGYPTLTG